MSRRHTALTRLLIKDAETSAHAQHQLSQRYAEGLGVEQSDEKMLEYLYKAAITSNLPQAQHELGVMHYNGFKVRQDFNTAMDLIEKAAAQNYLPAKHSLAMLYWHGVACEKNIEKAVEIFKDTALHGHKQSVETLRQLYSALLANYEKADEINVEEMNRDLIDLQIEDVEDILIDIEVFFAKLNPRLVETGDSPDPGLHQFH